MKRALVCSGGGVHGAFQVGVLEHLIKNLNRTYSIFCGISVGALNCGFLSMYKPNASVNAIDGLKNLWLNIDNSKVRKHWLPFGPLHILWEKSYYNSKPLHNLVKSELKPDKIKSSGNQLCVGAVALETGEYKVFDQNYPDLADAILASSAFPMMLTPVQMEGKLWIDGGAREVTPLKNAIDLGAEEIDVIMTSPKGLPKKYQDYKTIPIGLRTLDIIYDEIVENDINIALLINQLVSNGLSDKKNIPINIIRPDNLLSGNPLDFDPKLIRNEISMGNSSALKYK